MAIDSRDEEGGIRVLTLNRPPAHAIDAELLKEMARACEAAARDDGVRVVVLTGSGKFFCGGLDLKSVTAGNGEWLQHTELGRNDGLFALWTLPKPTLAMVNGHAIAGGAILTLACDVRIAVSTGAKIGLNETAIGLAFPVGALEIVRLALTNRQARRVLLEAGLHPPDVARELGLVDEIVEPARLEETCLARARTLARLCRCAYAHTKRALQQEAVDRVHNETAAHRKTVYDVWTSEETRQALLAQLAGVGKKP